MSGKGADDYTQWHGFFEVAKIFYTEFIPEAERIMPGGTADVMNSDYRKWTKGLATGAAWLNGNSLRKEKVEVCLDINRPSHGRTQLVCSSGATERNRR